MSKKHTEPENPSHRLTKKTITPKNQRNMGFRWLKPLEFPMEPHGKVKHRNLNILFSPGKNLQEINFILPNHQKRSIPVNPFRTQGLCSLCWLYEYVKLTPNFAASGASESDEGEAQAWRNGWAQLLPDVMDGALQWVER